MQRQCHLCLQSQRRVATGKHQLEALIRNRTILHLCCSSLLFLLDQFLQKRLFARQSVHAAQAVDSLVPRGGSNPRARIARNAFHRPVFKRHEHGVLQRILSQLEVPDGTNQRSKNAISFLPEGVCHNLADCIHFTLPVSLEFHDRSNLNGTISDRGNLCREFNSLIEVLTN